MKWENDDEQSDEKYSPALGFLGNVGGQSDLFSSWKIAQRFAADNAETL